MESLYLALVLTDRLSRLCLALSQESEAKRFKTKAMDFVVF
jgi:hypothetical protein